MSATLSVGLNIANTILGGIQQREDIRAQNKAIEQQFEMNSAATRMMLSSLGMRVSKQSSEIDRDKLRTDIEVQKQATKAIGSERVRIAQAGITGKRASAGIQDVKREEANIISDAEINAEIAKQNLQNQYLDSANKAITNLNNSVPNTIAAPSYGDLALGAISTGIKSYASFDRYDKAEFNKTVSNIDKSIYDFFRDE